MLMHTRKAVARLVTAAAATVVLTGCFHYTVVSGAPAAQTKVDIPWQKSWVAGLVPPDTIQSRETCPQGIASFETKHSFLNGLVRGLTYSIFTPIHPTVTCAAGPVSR